MRTNKPFLVVSSVFFATILLAPISTVRADQPAPNKTAALLLLMRLDEGLLVGLTASLKRSCEAAPVERREECKQLALGLLHDVDHGGIAKLMTPFFDQVFSAEEIGALTDFYGSREGKLMTELTVQSAYNLVDPSMPKPLPAIERATQEAVRARLEAFGRSPASAKLTQLMPQIVQEEKRQLLPFVCELYQKHGFSCAGLGLSDDRAK